MSFSLTKESTLFEIIDSFKFNILPLLKLLLSLDKVLKLLDLIFLLGLLDGSLILFFVNLFEFKDILYLGDAFSLLDSLKLCLSGL